MSDDAQRELREVQAYFRLPGLGLVEKDLHVVRAIAALAAIDAAPFALVFGGGTALARAHRIIRRMSEDVDFKIVPGPAAPVSRSIVRQPNSERCEAGSTQELCRPLALLSIRLTRPTPNRATKTTTRSGSFRMTARAGQGRGFARPSRSR